MNDFLLEFLVVSALFGVMIWLGRQVVRFPEIRILDALHRVLQFFFVLLVVWVVVWLSLNFVAALSIG